MSLKASIHAKHQSNFVLISRSENGFRQTLKVTQPNHLLFRASSTWCCIRVHSNTVSIMYFCSWDVVAAMHVYTSIVTRPPPTLTDADNPAALPPKLVSIVPPAAHARGSLSQPLTHPTLRHA